LIGPIWAIENTAMMMMYGAKASQMSFLESAGSSSRLRISSSCRASAVAAPAIAGRGPAPPVSPSSGSAGCQTRSVAMMAPAESSDATMSVSSTET
jgi:hypothetical protein